MAPLDQRKCQVLRFVVEDYVRSAEPVGSRTIARRYALGYSPATIRNDMADLKELGYLDQPHTSAGRVPSDKGYRFYVDRLMARENLSLDEIWRLHEAYRRGVRSVEWLLRETVRLLSEATRYAVVAMGPDPGQERLRSLKVLPVGEDEALLVLVTDTDLVHHGLLEIPEDTDFEEVQAMVGLLEERLSGVSVAELEGPMLRDFYRSFASRRTLLDQVFDLVTESFRSTQPDGQVVVGGTSKVLSQPEYQDVGRLRSFLAFLEEPQGLRELLLEQNDGMGVVIGTEHRVSGASDLALVTAGIRRAEGVGLRFGVLGPKRMDYGRVIALVEAIAVELDDLLA